MTYLIFVSFIQYILRNFVTLALYEALKASLPLARVLLCNVRPSISPCCAVRTLWFIPTELLVVLKITISAILKLYPPVRYRIFYYRQWVYIPRMDYTSHIFSLLIADPYHAAYIICSTLSLRVKYSNHPCGRTMLPNFDVEDVVLSSCFS